MKKNLLTILAIAGLVAFGTTSVTSCNDRNNENTETVSSSFDHNDFKGTVKSGEIATLNASLVYKLTGPVIVEDGGQLVIPAGTRIESTAGTNGYVLVKQGGQIFVNGTATAPVVFTSPNATPGDWGGIVICGKAPINTGATTASSEVGAAPYGGNVTNDNSGTIRYVRIEYAGAIFSDTKEFNGLSLFGVGNGTTVEYVQVYASNDDGIEWFGGTVDSNYLVVNGADDDSFDWTEGWNGKGSNWYANRFDNRGNRGIEADNNANNHANTPYSFPTISNLTLVGNTSGSESQGIKLRVGTKGHLDNVVLSNWNTGIDIQHDTTLGHIASGDLKITNVKFENVGTKAKGEKSDKSSFDISGAYTENEAAKGAGNGTGIPSWAQGWTRSFN
ncbi:hypothetical protein [Bergeyella sp. RCAD1439]|uniref:hypothetical protein n=1 Tax=Bergeyella anatis TaxID=3113737 RepID=UPI002E17F850|nr:hypothetical protein [Bergeyella sp. RCAD1439]